MIKQTINYVDYNGTKCEETRYFKIPKVAKDKESYMKTWKIPVVWQMMGTVNVVADTLAEAMKIAKDEEGTIPLPDNGSYLDESWELASDDMQLIRECYNGNQED